MFKVKGKNLFLNRGDQITLTVILEDGATFSKDDKIRFYIMKKGNSCEVLFDKTFTVEQSGSEFDIVLSSEETKIGDEIKSGERTYWYEIELNGDTTLVGYDDKGPKILTLYPEAIIQ